MELKYEKFIKEITFRKTVNGAWCGTYVCADGYSLSYAAGPDEKRLAARSRIMTKLYEMATDYYKRKNITIG